MSSGSGPTTTNPDRIARYAVLRLTRRDFPMAPFSNGRAMKHFTIGGLSLIGASTEAAHVFALTSTTSPP